MNALESERAIIGAALYSPQDCSDAFERLRGEHFSGPVNAMIWDRILASVRSMAHPEPRLIHEHLSAFGSYTETGGLRYLAEMVDAATTLGLGAHVDMILERAARRSISNLGRNVAQAAERLTEGSAESILAQLEREAAEIAREGVSAPLAVSAGIDALDMVEAAWRGDNRGVPVGLQCLDNVTGGIRQEDVWVLAARTSVGKSVAALSLALRLAQQNRGVIIFSLEMPRREVQARLIADLAFRQDRVGAPRELSNLRYSDLLKGRGNTQQHQDAREAARALASLPIVISDAGGLTIDEIRSQSLRQVRAWERAGVKAGAIVIDHIGLVRPARKTDSKAADTADLVNELKPLAKVVKAPVIALAQINRGPESRQDKRPTIADMNWSGAIEQIADLICLLYREAYYLERSSERADQDAALLVEHDMDLLIHKNRSGPICNLKCFVDVACNAVRDLPGEEVRRYA